MIDMEARPIPGTEELAGDLLRSYRVPGFPVNSCPYGTEVGDPRTVLRAAYFPATQPAVAFSFVTATCNWKNNLFA